jgi:hypothetical protein
MAVITSVEVMHGRTVRLGFADGSVRVVDLSPFLWGSLLGPLATDDALFAAASVDPVAGTIVWPNGADLDPDVLHGDYEPAFLSGPSARPLG